MVGFPVEILMQPLTARELLAGFACQAGWLLLSLLLCAGLWRAGLRRYASAKG